MSIIQIKSLKTNINQTIDDITNLDKTSKYADICKDYDMFGEYVTVLNCVPIRKWLKERFQDTRAYYGKDDKVKGYIITQSFNHNTINKYIAHKVGVELAEEITENKYQTIISTHINEVTPINYILINSVSFENGYKFRNNLLFYRDVLLLSDKLCQKHDVHEIKTCKWCKEEFKSYKFRRKGHNTGVFCSKGCHGAYTIYHREKSVISKIESEFGDELKNNGIVFIPQYITGNYIADFYIPATNTIIEFDGAYWHSLPKQIKKDKIKNDYYKIHNYNLIRIPEMEFRNNKDELIQNLKLQLTKNELLTSAKR